MPALVPARAPAYTRVVGEIRIVDVTDEASFGLVPPCADPGFDHRTCDYWENEFGGSKAARASWLASGEPEAPARPDLAGNPFAPRGPSAVPDWLTGGGDEPADNPFAPRRTVERPRTAGVPRKLALLDRGRGVFGSYAKALLLDGEPAAYAQFGPLSAYPRARQIRELYPQLPASPLPAIITCIATTREASHGGHAHALIAAVCDDLAGRGFSAVEVYPEAGAHPERTSAASPRFWRSVGFALAADDDRFPVMRREL